MTISYFTLGETITLRKGQELVRSYICGRTLTLTSNHGVYLSVSGRGVPRPITIRCRRGDVNRVATCLLTGNFE